MGIISGFSTDAFSAEETGRFLLPLLRWMLPGISPETLDFVHVVVRKGMHVTEFGVLALLWYRALRWGKPGWHGRTALGAFLLSAGFALADEFHQAFVPSRTGSLVDAGWDSLGAALALMSLRVLWLRAHATGGGLSHGRLAGGG
jgi:VanZ family protein